MESFIEYFEEENGDDIEIEYKDVSFLSKFKTFLIENKNISRSNLDELFSELNNLILDYSGLSFDKFEEICKKSDLFMDYSNEEQTSYGQCLSEFIQTLGYDGIIMSAAQFKNMNHTLEATHYIVFNPNNIKLADGSNMNFSLNNDDIRYKTLLIKPDTSISEKIALQQIALFHTEFPNLNKTKLFKTQEEASNYTKKNVKDFIFLIKMKTL